MTEQEKKRYIDYMILRDELEEEKKQGYTFACSGQEATPAEIASICVFQEETSYMRDYIRGPHGKSPVISFNPVRS